MKIKEIIRLLESIAPPMYQEGYDNAGLITGDARAKAKGAILCLDATEAVIEEAISKKCNLVIAHHPIVFKGLKRLNGRNYVERVVIKAIKHDIAIYAIHTNLDNVYHHGVNAKFAERLGLQNTQILAPKGKLLKLSVVVPTNESDHIRKALFNIGVGTYNEWQQRSYASLGVGTQDGNTGAQVKLEMLFPEPLKGAVLSILHQEASPCAYDISNTANVNQEVGSGMMGQLPKPMSESAFLKMLKKEMGAKCIRHTQLLDQPIQKVALCGGAGSFLLSKAKAKGADIFITGDYKYHEFFDADGQIVIADIGHYESEQYTIELLKEIISQKFTNFAAYCTEVNTNPINYF
jgi:dinuclear metal center YbgI/SA1388 family protein